MQTTPLFRLASLSLAALALTACGGGGGATVGTQLGNLAVGGSLSGLPNNTSVVLRNNGTDNLTVNANGTFTFATMLATGAAYNVTVLTQPTGQTCAVANGSGTLGSAAVTNVSITCTPQVGRFLYIPHAGGYIDGAAAVSVNGSTGALTRIPLGLVITNGSFATADPAGKYLYMLEVGTTTTSPQIHALLIDASTGLLTPHPSSPFPLVTPSLGNGPVLFNKPLMHPSGKFTYVGAVDNDNSKGKLYGHSIDSTGGLLELPVMNVGARQGLGTFNAAGTILYVPHDSGLPGAPGAGSVAVFQVNTATGVLTPQGDVATNGRDPGNATLTPSGKFLLVSNVGTRNVAVFAVDANGMLTAVAGSPFATGFQIYLVSAHPTRNFVYASAVNDATPFERLIAFQIDPGTGVLTPVTGSPFETGGYGPGAINLDPTGKFLYSTHLNDANVMGFTINQTTGALTAIAGSPWRTGDQPKATLDPSGRFLYVRSSFGESIASYSVDATTGALTGVGGVKISTGTEAAEVVGRQ